MQSDGWALSPVISRGDKWRFQRSRLPHALLGGLTRSLDSHAVTFSSLTPSFRCVTLYRDDKDGELMPRSPLLAYDGVGDAV